MVSARGPHGTSMGKEADLILGTTEPKVGIKARKLQGSTWDWYLQGPFPPTGVSDPEHREGPLSYRHPEGCSHRDLD